MKEQQRPKDEPRDEQLEVTVCIWPVSLMAMPENVQGGYSAVMSIRGKTRGAYRGTCAPSPLAIIQPDSFNEHHVPGLT